jgi:hypothetical protein
VQRSTAFELEEDPDKLLAMASRIVCHLRESWSAERSAQIHKLWQQLETDYGMILPRESLFPTTSIDVVCCDSDAPSLETSPGEEVSVEGLVGDLMEELDAVRRKRELMETRLRIPMSGAIPGPLRCASLCDDELRALRTEVSVLQERHRTREQIFSPDADFSFSEVDKWLHGLWEQDRSEEGFCTVARAPAGIVGCGKRSPLRVRKPCNVDAQLDEMLADLNEIERMHADVCGLAKH